MKQVHINTGADRNRHAGIPELTRPGTEGRERGGKKEKRIKKGA